MVGLVAFQGDHRLSVLRHSLSELLLKLLVSHSFMLEIDLSHFVYLLIGVVDIVELVNIPRVAVDIRVLQRHGAVVLQGQDKVFCIEHVEHGEDGVAVDLSHVTAGLSDGRHHLLHLRSDVCLDHLLITAELGSMIATDALVII